MASISERENREIEAANAAGNTPVVFIHGLWLLPSSWPTGRTLHPGGHAPLPDWPDDPETVEEARANPDVLAKKTLEQVASHTTEIINALDRKPAVMGHSTAACWRRCSRAGASRRPRWRSTPESSAAFCFCLRPCSRGWACPRSTRSRAARDHAHVRPVQVRLDGAGREGGEGALRHVPRRRLRDRSYRWATRTSIHGRRRRWTRRTPTAVPC